MLKALEHSSSWGEISKKSIVSSLKIGKIGSKNGACAPFFDLNKFLISFYQPT
jgi:hypothetical protein